MLVMTARFGEAVDPAKRVADAEMAGWPSMAQPVDDPEVEVLERRPAPGDIAWSGV
jgi:hypothetical protein